MAKNPFEGDNKFKSPIMEDKDIWSIRHMDDEELRQAVIEQTLILYMEYKMEQFTFEEFMGSLRLEDCIESYKVKFSSESLTRFETQLKAMGTNLYWKLWVRVYKTIQELVSSGHLIMVNEDTNYRKKATVLRFFDPNTSKEGIHQICQQFMNECGCWWEGEYVVPEGVSVVSLTEKGKDLLANNSADAIAEILTHEMIFDSSDKIPKH